MEGVYWGRVEVFGEYSTKLLLSAMICVFLGLQLCLIIMYAGIHSPSKLTRKVRLIVGQAVTCYHCGSDSPQNGHSHSGVFSVNFSCAILLLDVVLLSDGCKAVPCTSALAGQQLGKFLFVNVRKTKLTNAFGHFFTRERPVELIDPILDQFLNRQRHLERYKRALVHPLFSHLLLSLAGHFLPLLL